MRGEVVYLMANEFGMVKIGVSVHPEKRVRQLTNASGKVFRFPHVGSTARQVEQDMHYLLGGMRTCGEWFPL
ncbi:GIY-YIG nuclease family protein [Vibrio sp. SCSIO 43140]|uniref:GIY-YIG nuclease family protein n=1 Tax=Vibrio sp. SCSIO 43140 TaxID=2819100 RepID=UPI002074BD77|nr:GIY-YIG nuclease family protein [Vibrio sp. SCSIO 43140]USD58807.1 GIY-YIG nuclease family protein [Vibrio sp. SCSIO 43140]